MSETPQGWTRWIDDTTIGRMAGSNSGAAKSGDRPLLVFISYSHRDGEFRERLEVHLSSLRREGLETWFDGDMLAGDELDPTIRRKLKQADIFVALASPDYLHSRYCYEREYQFALRKASRKKIHVVVAIARRCSWRHTRMGRYLALPKDGKAIEDFSRRTRAYEQIVDALRVIAKRIRAESTSEGVRPSLPRKPGAEKAGSAKSTTVTSTPVKRGVRSAEPSITAASPPRKGTGAASPKNTGSRSPRGSRKP